MKKALKITFGTVMAAAVVAPVYAFEDFFNYSSVSVTATYTKPSNNGLSFGDLIAPVASDTSGYRRANFVGLDHDLDWAIGFTYHFPGTQTRFFATYDHFSSEDDESAFNLDNIFIGPGLGASVTTQAFGFAHHHTDEVKVGLSHLLAFGPCFHINVKGFLEWDNLHRDFYESNFGFDAAGVITNFNQRFTHEDVDGFGPGVGAVARGIPFGDYSNWGIFAGAMASVLYTDNEYNRYLYTDLDLDYFFDPESSHSLVGKLDISFGIDFFCPSAYHGELSWGLTLGMRYMNMFNVFKNGNSVFDPDQDDTSRGDTQNLGWAHDFGRFGPFLTFRIGGGRS